ncbi:quinone oxidoreductase family protein [Kribbella jiaozuonensis]|uniref:Zinc-binding dehydrogenase n=1 Tax=Kribbella jiaozuonensis TaxID=2575441 RepID=A0A4U3M1Z6_9ACTN|nr:zinc-binding dehydrogenase [Kribbella jiaozuonensis]TKK82641.1 zinc-binding dehydrogenase [Kribbella jiaozuonensis]
MRAIQVTQFGGPEVLVPTELDPPVAGPDQLLVEVSAAGVNFADTHRTDGSYRGGVKLPFVPGVEIVGRTNDRRILSPIFETGGGYAECAVAPAHRAVDVPDEVSDGQALALLIQGLTAWHVLKNSARLSPGETVLVNAAAGGVGSLAVQLAKYFGAGQVIATASTADKRELALELGADVAVDNNPDGYAERVLEATDGVDVVLDSTGGPTMLAGLECLKGFGRLVNYGNAGREGRPSVDPSALAQRNLSVAGFWLVPAMDLPGGYVEPLTELLALTAAKKLSPLVGAEYPLEEARRSHEDLLARRTTGKLILKP